MYIPRHTLDTHIRSGTIRPAAPAGRAAGWRDDATPRPSRIYSGCQISSPPAPRPHITARCAGPAFSLIYPALYYCSIWCVIWIPPKIGFFIVEFHQDPCDRNSTVRGSSREWVRFSWGYLFFLDLYLSYQNWVGAIFFSSLGCWINFLRSLPTQNRTQAKISPILVSCVLLWSLYSTAVLYSDHSSTQETKMGEILAWVRFWVGRERRKLIQQPSEEKKIAPTQFW